jgi:Putative Actinobacterial Holin-X, holin superfamily III
MPTQETDVSLGNAAKLVAEKASTIARLELELASMELKKKAAALGVGIGLALGAVAVGLYGIGFLFATVAAGLAEFMPLWLALLIVTLGLLLTAGVLGALGLRSIKRGTPPVPEQAIDEAKLTTQALKSNGSA